MGRPSVKSKLTTAGEKACSTCKVVKPFSEFYVDRVHSTGFSCNCKECARKVCKTWRQNNSKRFKELNKEWREANREYNKERLKAWNRAHPWKTSEYQATKYAKDKNKVLERNKRWRENNQEKVRPSKSLYAARKRNASGSYQPEDIKALFVSQNSKCVFCKTELKNGYHVDHIQPLSKGGSNYKENIQLLCKTCNLSKRNKTQEQFAKYKGITL